MKGLFCFISICTLLSVPVLHAQPASIGPSVDLIENRGQWKSSIQFAADIADGNLYLEDGRLVFVLYRNEDLERLHYLKHHPKKDISESDLIINGHRFDLRFVNSNAVRFSGRKKRPNYYNYYIGKNAEHWAGGVPAYEMAVANNIWNDIDYHLYSQNVDLKYDFIVHPGGDINDIWLEADHLEKIYLKHGNLYFRTSVNEIIDVKPVAWQKIDGRISFVPCEYRLKDNRIGFSFPEGYRKNVDLVLDPKLIFSSYTGSSRDNWGYTATFDHTGNLYGAGAVFSTVSSSLSYPTTTGAFQTSFGGGKTDIGISKFKSDGSTLLFSTYLGGSGSELAHSLVVTDQNDLVVMGTTSSTDYPVTSNAYDTTYNISGTASTNVSVIVHYVGSDIVLSKFNSAGTSMIGSTYIGGSGFDGLNINNLKFNYGDDVRGEVIVDKSGNIMVASTTQSTNFPVTNFSTHKGGLQDAVIFQMDSSLSTLNWSTYLGGNNNDAAYSLKVDKSGRTYVTGGTRSTNFPTTINAIHPAYLGGIDGFVSVINPLGFGIPASTRLGTTAYDQAYFVQLDDSGYVYVTGQTEGNYTTWPAGVYSNPYSGQFIHKMTPGLDSTIFQTVIGTGGSSSNITVDISPSAFLVNQCDHIYLSGWGGLINSNYSNATSSTTTGLPTTTGAHKTTTDGNDFYLIVLDRNADSLLYATFFGGSNTSSGEHVDGGTSRFDKRGIVYQAVCAGCGGNNTFPTSPNNVWASSNGSNNCNLGVIKFDLSQLTSNVGLDALTKVCVPGTVNFVNSSNGGTNYFWDFGDGNTSIQFQPSHTYQDTGDFVVRLIVSDSLSCLLADTTFITVRGEAPPIANVQNVPVICPGDSVMLNASGGIKYQWIPPTYLNNDTIPNPLASPPATQSYTVVVADSCGSDTSNYFAFDTASVNVVVAVDPSTASSGDTICKGQSVQLTSSGGNSYAWVPPTGLSNSAIPNPLATPQQTTNYTVSITDNFGCVWERFVTVRVEDPQNPNIFSSPDTTICLGDTVDLYITGGTTYSWSPGQFIGDTVGSQTRAFPVDTTIFLIKVHNKCFNYTDTIEVNVVNYKVTAMPDTFACRDVPLQLQAGPGKTFSWEPSASLIDPQSASPKALIREETVFYVYASDEYGCSDLDSVVVALRPAPYLNAGNDRVIRGNGVILEAKGNGSFTWEPRNLVECQHCQITKASVPGSSQLFRLKLVDEFGCVNSDQVLISKMKDALFVPNSFTPNSDTKNEVFRAYGYNIEDFKLSIFNRWGEVIFISSDIERGWDGTFKGEDVVAGTYVYVITYRSEGEEKEKKGSVTLLK